MVDFRKAALEYAAMGWPVFPLASGMKLPAIGSAKGGKGVKDATTDTETIDRWAKSYPNANLGLACGVQSGIVVVDIDPRNGANDTLAALAKKGRGFPDCPAARTGGGGVHLLFRYDDRIINSKGKVGPGIDVKTSGGYIVAAPSFVKQPDGSIGDGHYAWVKHPQDVLPPRLPIWLTTILAPAPAPPRAQYTPLTDGPKSIASLLAFVSKSGEGDRNNRLYWGACRAADAVKARQVSEGSAIDQLMFAAIAVGLPHKEAIATIISAFKRGDDAAA